MRKRPLGKTGLDVSEIALGTWGLSGQGYGPVDAQVQDDVIDRALSLGITLFETADSYADGAMEKRLGERVPKDEGHLIVTLIGTDKASKPLRKRFDAEYIAQAFEQCVERQQRDMLDIVLLHNPSEKAVSKSEAGEVLQGFVEAGRLKAWGISAGSQEVAQACVECTPAPQVVQLPYNAFHSGPMGAVGAALHDKGIGILARSVLAHGLLVGQWRLDKRFPRGDHRAERWTPDQLERRIFQLRALRALQQGPRVQTLRAAALRYVLDNEQVSSAVLGPRNTIQLDQLVRESGGGPPYLNADAKRRTIQRLSELGALR